MLWWVYMQLTARNGTFGREQLFPKRFFDAAPKDEHRDICGRFTQAGGLGIERAVHSVERVQYVYHPQPTTPSKQHTQT